MFVYVIYVSFSHHPIQFQQQKVYNFHRSITVQIFINLRIMTRTNSFVIFRMYVLFMVGKTNVGLLVQ